MHLGQLKLRLCSRSCGEGHIADDVSKSLSIDRNVISRASNNSEISISPTIEMRRCSAGMGVPIVPFRLVLSEDLPLGVISDDLDIDEASQVELL